MPLKILLLSFLLAALPWAPVSAQQPDPPPGDAASAADALPIDDEGGLPADWRDVGAYPFPAISRTVRDMQNLAYAMQLRDYCADDRVPDAFVLDRLARFSVLTGRQETCRTLLEY